MLREHVESIRSSLVVADSHAASMRIHRRIQNGTLRRLLSGVYIPTALLDRHGSSECRDIVFIARVCALSLRYPDYVMSGVVAAYLLGLPCEARIGQLTLYAPSRKCPTFVHFPEVVIDDSIRIPSVCVRTCRPGRPVSSIEYIGFRIASPARVLIDCARTLDDKHAFLIACAALARVCQFDRSVRMRRGRGRRKRGGISTRLWMPLPATPEGAGTPVGSSTMPMLVASLPARPWFSLRCCGRGSPG